MLTNLCAYSSGRKNFATTHQERKKYRSTGLLLPENISPRKKKDNCNDLDKFREKIVNQQKNVTCTVGVTLEIKL